MLRGDAAFALPEVYEYLEVEGFQYAIRLPANQVLQEQIAPLLTRPVGRPPHYVRRFYASFRYQAQSWSRARRVVAKVEWHPGELYPRVGFIVTNLRRPARRSSPSTTGAGRPSSASRRGRTRSSGRGCRARPSGPTPCGSSSTRWPTTSPTSFARLALPGEVARWSLTSLRDKVVKIGAKVIAHGRYAIFQMAEVAVPRELFGRILDRIARLRPPDPAPC